MKLDIGVLSTTIEDYEDVITKLDDIKGRIQKTVSVLSNKGWSGESQKKYDELVDSFISKDYECLQENLKCIKEVLDNDAKSQSRALKNRCEDFVNCINGSERGVYHENDGASTGILSLDYDTASSVIDNVTEITNHLVSEKRAELDDLSDTIKGGWIFGGLKYSSFNIDNELAESSNQINQEERRLNAFLQSFIEYTPGVKRLEETVCIGLNKVEKLDKTVEKNINNIDASVKLGTGGKILKAGKTVLIDIGGGTWSVVQGGALIVGSTVAEPVTGGLSTFGYVAAGSMVVSGGNCAANGGRDIVRMMNGEWGEIGSTNYVADTISDVATYTTGDKETGDLVGNGAITFIDLTGSIGGITKTGVNDVKRIVNTGKGAIKLPGEIRGTRIATLSNYKYGTLTNVRTIRDINVNPVGLINGTYRVGKDLYNDANAFYSAKTIYNDATNSYNAINVKLGIPKGSTEINTVKSWLEKN